MIESLRYTLKVWLTTAAVPPVVILIISYINDPTGYGIANFFGVMLVLGLAFSFFPWVAFSAGVYFIQKWHITTIRKKIAIQCLALPMVLVTFACFAANIDTLFAFYDSSFLLIVTYYAICLAASIQFYKLPQLYTQPQ